MNCGGDAMALVAGQNEKCMETKTERDWERETDLEEQMIEIE